MNRIMVEIFVYTVTAVLLSEAKIFREAVFDGSGDGMAKNRVYVLAKSWDCAQGAS
jgi:hypothetical protein